MYECRCDERLKTKAEESTHWVARGTGTPKVETSLIDEMFASGMGE
jgi:hypothetical protein